MQHPGAPFVSTETEFDTSDNSRSKGDLQNDLRVADTVNGKLVAELEK